MKIELSENEIKTAIIDYVTGQGIKTDPSKTEVDLKAGRGDNGMTAYVIINEPSEKIAAPTAVEPADNKKLKFGSNG